MAQRPVFLASENSLQVLTIDFKFFSGFSIQQKQKSIDSLHESFRKNYPQDNIIEISSKSKDELGVKLSAFNLTIKTIDNHLYPIENVFQSSKVFENGGPYVDLLTCTPVEAKKDPRIKNSGRVTGFIFNDKSYPLDPKTLYYNWLYIHALAQRHNADLRTQLKNFNAFTDIEFNPKKSFNCQAEACAVFIYLSKNGVLKEALKDIDYFTEVIYKNRILNKDVFQLEFL